MLETTVILALSIWLAFFGINYASMAAGFRRVVLPWLFPRIAYALQCPICFALWVMVALSLFIGFTPLALTTPVAVLFIDLCYWKLRD